MLKIIQRNWSAEANLVVNNKECFCLGTIGVIVAPWKFDVIKASIFALEALPLGQYTFVFRTIKFP